MLCLDDLHDGPMRVIWKVICFLFPCLYTCFVGSWSFVPGYAGCYGCTGVAFQMPNVGFWSQSAEMAPATM